MGKLTKSSIRNVEDITKSLQGYSDYFRNVKGEKSPDGMDAANVIELFVELLAALEIRRRKNGK